MLLLDPSQIGEPPNLEGQEVTVVKPDGVAASFTVTSCEAHHGIVGLFFGGVPDGEIPVGSSVVW